ncbi:hypothetical protein [Paraburkholderia pallida]|uniref:Uncharacterized protein n=1 Tax=Paraburkholderia pallida TaxID=2547399 RepID=A0A4P7CPY3_9BURK|nr:hypothetical protein [Paraburkholderia pallida]QBQ97860.1 hypothetical protein E1956_12190 [Paraburkholderia pallida]
MDRKKEGRHEGAANDDDKTLRVSSDDRSPNDPLTQASALDVLTRLCDAGVQLTVDPPGIYYYGHTFSLTPSEALDYVRDPDAVVAGIHGVSVETLNAWRDAGGMYRCHATTRQGKRCLRAVAGESDCVYDAEADPAKWIEFERHGYCCTQHGGERKGGRS